MYSYKKGVNVNRIWQLLLMNFMNALRWCNSVIVWQSIAQPLSGHVHCWCRHRSAGSCSEVHQRVFVTWHGSLQAWASGADWGCTERRGSSLLFIPVFFFSFFLFWRWEGWGTLFTRSHFPPTPHPHPTILLTTCSVCSFPLPAGLLVYCHRCHSLVRPQRIWTSSLIPCHLHDPVVTVWV